MKSSQELLSAIQSRKVKVGIVGLGYVGLPLLISFFEEGFNVFGFDIDQKKINMLASGLSYIKHLSSEKIKEISKSNKSKFSVNFSDVQEVDAIILCVPTPLTEYREPDLSYIENTVESIVPFLRKGQIISLESTSYPGTTEEVIRPKLENKGWAIGKDIYLVYSPEREDPGNKEFTIRSIPKVVGGSTGLCRELGGKLYSSIFDEIVLMSSTRAAEMTKLVENIHRAVNIGLVNELKILADKMGIDLYEVIRAASTKPFGFVPYYPGPGLGGHCIPIDPFYLTWKAREFGVHTRFIELAGEINSSMPAYVVDKIAKALNDRSKCVKGSRFLILGLAYKKNVDDMRESPSVEIIGRLMQLGGIVEYVDPYILKYPKVRNSSYEMISQDITKETLANYDAVVLVTDHDIFDYQLIHEASELIIDTRGRFDSSLKVVRA